MQALARVKITVVCAGVVITVAFTAVIVVVTDAKDGSAKFY